MKHFFTGLAFIGAGLPALAQPDCSQIVQASFTSSVQENVLIVTSSSFTMFPQATSYEWTFGDGETGSGGLVTHVYDSPGIYNVCLYALVENCVDSTCQQVVVMGGSSPCDDLSAEFTMNIQGSQVAFDNTASSNLFSYQWFFGDGTTAYGENPVHTYPEPGTYAACLVAWAWDPLTQDTCFDENCEIVVIEEGNQPCDALEAGFFANAFPYGAQFSNATAGTGFQTTWQWSFGDGSSSNDAQPAHTYAASGWYLVCLSAVSIYEQNGGGVITCVDSVCQEVFIPGDPGPCDSLSAFFNVTTQGNLAAFTTYGGTAIGYQWTFGDGTQGDGPAPTHVYPGPGTYQACLVTWAWNPLTQDTCYADHCAWITIGADEPCDSTFACFQWGLENNTVQFYNCSDSNSDLNYWWSFGDGTNSDGYQPIHTYPGPGAYTVCLTVWTSGSQGTCSDTLCNTLVIQGGPSPCDSLSAYFEVFGIETQAVFTSFGGTAAGYHWTFGDGTQGDDPNPVHVYPGPGTYQACLVTWTWDPQTQDTCYADHCEWITIGSATPCDSLQGGFVANVGDATVWFSNTTVGTGFQTTWYWDFGDGTTSNDAQPSHVFPGLGTYEVCLTVTTLFEQQGGEVITCEDTYCHPVVTGGGSPCDDFMVSFEWSDLFNGAVHFYGSANQPASGYLWSFGDGSQGNGMSPIHEYAEPGGYQVCLSAWHWDQQTQDSCWAEHCEWIQVVGEDSPCDSIAAHFVWEPAGPNMFLFHDASETNGQGVYYWWTFGDGTSADGPNPDHTYQQPGQYQVCLTITVWNSPDTCTSTTCQILNVLGGDPPCDGLNAEFAVNIAGLQVDLHAGVNPPGTTYAWLIDGDQAGDGANAEHVFPGPGVYNVCLIVGNYDPLTQDSCFEDHCQLITITGGGMPCDSLWVIQFEYDHEGNVYTFFNTSNTQGSTVSTHWDFGDGTSGDDPQIVHTYADAGEYLVCMTITGIVPGTDDTCQTTVCEDIGVILGLDETQGEHELSAWPQPFEDVLQLESAGLQGLAHLSLLDMTGRVVDVRSINAAGRLTVRYDALPTGAYVLRLQNGTMDRCIRVVKR